MDKLNVTFQGVVSKQVNCLCACCHDTTKVLKVHIPLTLYFDGKNLSAKYHELWICKSCAEKLMAALGKITDCKIDGAGHGSEAHDGE
jgi:predicted metal-binding protein